MKVEGEADELLAMIVAFDKLAGKFDLGDEIQDAKSDDSLARRYLAGVAVVQFTACRLHQFEQGVISKETFAQQGRTVMQSIVDLRMYESNEQHSHVLPFDVKQEFDQIYQQYVLKNEAA